MAELIEKVAHAIDAQFVSDGNVLDRLDCARAAIAAIEASETHRVVPVVPNHLMLADGEVVLASFAMPEWGPKSICQFIYENMLAAAPKVTE